MPCDQTQRRRPNNLHQPPGVPADRVAALRAAFHAAMNDPGFIADAATIQIEINETSSERVTEVIAAAYAMPPEVVAAANSAMNLTGASAGR